MLSNRHSAGATATTKNFVFLSQSQDPKYSVKIGIPIFVQRILELYEPKTQYFYNILVESLCTSAGRTK